MRSVRILAKIRPSGSAMMIMIAAANQETAAVRDKIPKIDTTNRIKPISRCHPECRFMAFSALMRYGIKHRKTTTAGSEIINILLTYCIKLVMSHPP